MFRNSSCGNGIVFVEPQDEVQAEWALAFSRGTKQYAFYRREAAGWDATY